MKNRLMQLFRNNAGKGLGIKVEQNDNEATIYLYDAIGDWYGLSAKDFIKELTAIKAETIHLRINSPGGDVFEARAIATAIQQSKSKVIAHIDGVCASAATYIATSAAEVEMAQGSFFMIHNAWTLSMGNSDELRETANLLDKVDGSIVSDYRKKTGKEEKEIQDLMAAETWMTADEALANKFIDRVFDGDPVENKWNLSAYNNPPKVEQEEKLYDREIIEKRLQLIEAIS